MRHQRRYTTEFKESLIAKALADNAPSLVKLAQAHHVSYGALYRWVTQMKQRPKDRSISFKLQSLIETASMTEESKSAYCRAKGLYPHHLEEWKKNLLSDIEGSAKEIQALKKALQEKTLECHQKGQDLQRKDKALSEVSALLVLKKKADLIWGGSEDV